MNKISPIVLSLFTLSACSHLQPEQVDSHIISLGQSCAVSEPMLIQLFNREQLNSISPGLFGNHYISDDVFKKANVFMVATGPQVDSSAELIPSVSTARFEDELHIETQVRKQKSPVRGSNFSSPCVIVAVAKGQYRYVAVPPLDLSIELGKQTHAENLNNLP